MMSARTFVEGVCVPIRSRRIRDDDVVCGQEASEVIKQYAYLDNAPCLHFGAALALDRAGFSIIPEYPTKHLGDERNGKIDLVVTKDGGKAAIELDNHTPRKRSLLKLRLFDGYRIVVLRGRYWHGEPPEGIDEIINTVIGR